MKALGTVVSFKTGLLLKLIFRSFFTFLYILCIFPTEMQDSVIEDISKGNETTSKTFQEMFGSLESSEKESKEEKSKGAVKSELTITDWVVMLVWQLVWWINLMASFDGWSFICSDGLVQHGLMALSVDWSDNFDLAYYLIVWSDFWSDDLIWMSGLRYGLMAWSDIWSDHLVWHGVMVWSDVVWPSGLMVWILSDGLTRLIVWWSGLM